MQQIFIILVLELFIIEENGRGLNVMKLKEINLSIELVKGGGKGKY